MDPTRRFRAIASVNRKFGVNASRPGRRVYRSTRRATRTSPATIANFRLAVICAAFAALTLFPIHARHARTADRSKSAKPLCACAFLTPVAMMCGYGGE